MDSQRQLDAPMIHRKCIFDGGEIRFDLRVIDDWRHREATDVNRAKTTNANDNVAYKAYALAA